MPMRRSILLVSVLSIISIFTCAQAAKPKLTLDEVFNSVSFPTVKVSPDGNSVVIETEKADWNQQIFRKELWLYRNANASLIQLTQAGHEGSPQWSPDGKWIAFLSERKSGDAKDSDSGDSKARSQRGNNKEKDKDSEKDKGRRAALPDLAAWRRSLCHHLRRRRSPRLCLVVRL
jgi:dipeptidyl aminopeptidase/acylaminoacyl peptidase